MKNTILLLMIVFLTSGIWSCKTKKSTTDFKETKIEKIGISDLSTTDIKETVDENNKEVKTEIVTDKSFIDAWMSLESDKITITDKNGTITEITKPRISQKQSQTNDVVKVDKMDSEKNKVATSQENQQNNITANASNETTTNLKETNSSKGKEPIWLWIVGGCVVGGLAYLVLRRFKLI